jgi:hypothetical protein
MRAFRFPSLSAGVDDTAVSQGWHQGGVVSDATAVSESSSYPNAGSSVGSSDGRSVRSRSSNIPLPSSHVVRTQSELQLSLDEAAAEQRDATMFYRVLNGLRERQLRGASASITASGPPGIPNHGEGAWSGSEDLASSETDACQGEARHASHSAMNENGLFLSLLSSNNQGMFESSELPNSNRNEGIALSMPIAPIAFRSNRIPEVPWRLRADGGQQLTPVAESPGQHTMDEWSITGFGEADLSRNALKSTQPEPPSLVSLLQPQPAEATAGFFPSSTVHAVTLHADTSLYDVEDISDEVDEEEGVFDMDL